jgi:tight adherence protein B
MMVLVGGTFVVVLLVFSALYWMFVVRPERQEKTSMVARLKGVREQLASFSLVKAERSSSVPLLDAALARRQKLSVPLQALLTQAGMKTTVGGFLMSSAAVGFGVGVLSWFVFHVMVAALVVGVLAALTPYFFVRYKRTKRLQVFEEQFPEAIDLIARALRAGHALTTGLGMVADEIPAPVGEEFKRLYDEQNFGMSLPEAMRAMAQRVPVLDARFFVTAVLTQREAGGNLSEVLDNLASVMRARFKVKRQIRVASAHGRLSAWVLAFLPPGLAAVLFTLSPNFMRVLWEDPWGVQLLLIAGALQIIGSVIIARLVRIEY